MTDRNKGRGAGKSAARRGMGRAEDKMGRVGAKTGGIVDRVVEAPGHLLHSTVSTATVAMNKGSRVAARGSRAAGDVAETVANRLDPDSDPYKK